jgi:ABC-type phosphate transport system permease subunit
VVPDRGIEYRDFFFQKVPMTEFLFGLNWSPQMAIRADQVGSSGSFGAVPLFTGTLLITSIAMVVAVPVGLMTAIYLAEYSSSRVRGIAKPLLEVLAGIPTVVYGFFAALTVVRRFRSRIGKCAGRGSCHGHHDHSPRIVTRRRCDQRRTDRNA